LLVKTIVSSNPLVRDQIIQATNNQNVVELASLHATDKIQRDIEDVLVKYEWYYERRKNYYRNAGKPDARIITPMFLAAAYVGIVMKNPAHAARLKSKFMRRADQYESVFSEATPLEVWPVLAEVVKRVEVELERVRPRGNGERFLARWRNLVALLVVARLCKTFGFGVKNIVGLDRTALTPSAIVEVWGMVEKTREMTREKMREGREQTASFVTACCETAAAEFGISAPQAVGRHSPESAHAERRSPTRDDLDAVDAALPVQPWPPGVHRMVAKTIGFSTGFVHIIIQELIRTGRRHRQKDGVVYDADGNVIAYDELRVRGAIDDTQRITGEQHE
jgi:hypothetical protein